MSLLGAAAQRREALAKLLLSNQGGTAEEASRRRSKLGAPSPHGGGKIVYRCGPRHHVLPFWRLQCTATESAPCGPVWSQAQR